MVTQTPYRFEMKDDTDDHLLNHVPGKYPIEYGVLRESLSGNRKEMIRFISYILQVVEANLYADTSLLAKHILFLLTGLSVKRFTSCTNVGHFINDKILSDCLQDCLAEEKKEHSSNSILLQALHNYKTDLLKNNVRQLVTPPVFTKEQLGIYIQDEINKMSSPPLSLLVNAWKIGIYVADMAHKTNIALTSIEAKLATTPAGLYTGAHKLACEIADAIERKFIPEDPAYVYWMKELLDKGNEGYSLKEGIAGYGIAILKCRNFLTPTFRDRLNDYTAKLIHLKILNPGFATGIAGITYFLLSYALQLGDKTALEAGHQQLIALTEKAKYHAGTMNWSSSQNSSDFWEEDGAMYTSLLYLKAFEMTNSEVYKRYAASILYNPGIYTIQDDLFQYCNLGNILTDATLVLKDRTWQSTTSWIATTIVQLKRKSQIENDSSLRFLLKYHNQLS